MIQEYERIFPPRDIFLYPDLASMDWEMGGAAKNAIFTNEGEMVFKSDYKSVLFHGFPFPPASDNVWPVKRLVMLKAKRMANPLSWLFWKRDLEEIRQIAEVSARRYFLKPECYAKPVREIFRLCQLILSEFWSHCIASIFQWDFAYRVRTQVYLLIMSKGGLIKDPQKEINLMLDFAIQTEEDLSLKDKYRVLKKALNLLWIFPRFRGMIKVVCKEVDLSQFVMDESDIKQAFK